MNILHTSDWHLGKYLENRERLPEQREALDEICRIAEERHIDLVLIAGDIFDTYIPAASAEELFYETLERLSHDGERAIVIIAGNHDSPERLCAAKPLVQRNGIILLGIPGSQATPSNRYPRKVNVVNSGQGWLEITVPGVSEHAVIITLPYPSEARLEEALSEQTDETILQQAYAEKVGRLFREAEQQFRQDTVNLAVSHLFVAGGESSDSERPIQLGGALTVPADQLPQTAQYIALGHLHKPQKAPGSVIPAYYAGSLLPYSFSETGYQKAVMLIEVFPGEPPTIEKLNLQSGKPLVKWKADNGLDEVVSWCKAGKDPDAWIDLEITVEHPLSQADIKMLRSLREDLIQIRPVIKNPDYNHLEVENRLSKPLRELFEGFYKARNGVLPKTELVEYFLKLAAEERDEAEKDVG